MKVRIILEEKCGKTIYRVQHKFLFWWITDSEYKLDWQGDFYKVSLVFDSMEEARNYVCKMYTKPIIKIFNLE
jgi:hypothetical protein